jgi:hypothetical protein
MRQLYIHQHHRLLHALDVPGGLLQEPSAVPQVGSKPAERLPRAKAAAQQAKGVQLLQPLTSVLRPGTFLANRAFTKITSKPRASRIS